MIGAVHLKLRKLSRVGSIASCRVGSTIPIRVRPLAESPFAPNFAKDCAFLGIPKKVKIIVDFIYEDGDKPPHSQDQTYLRPAAAGLRRARPWELTVEKNQTL